MIESQSIEFSWQMLEYIVTSCANNLTVTLGFKLSVMSLMNKLNSNGPITLPCGMPLHIEQYLETDDPTVDSLKSVR